MRQPSPSVGAGTAVAGPPCRRLLITGPGNVELIAEHLPPLGDHDVYARTIVSGISHGPMDRDLGKLHRASQRPERAAVLLRIRVLACAVRVFRH
jgi:hypothetical protein